MADAVRSKGRPNRGGGRFNHPRGRGRGSRGGGRGGGGGGGRGGGRGGGGNRGRGRGKTQEPKPGLGSRKGGAALSAAGYLGDAILEAREEYEPGEYNRAPRRRREPNKVAMQKLHMSVENQDLVRNTLLLLHGGQSEEPDAESTEDGYDELDWRAEDEYWTDDPQLVVEEVTQNQDQSESAQSAKFTRYAANKLLRYGFDRSYCETALDENDGDIGYALEMLLCKCFEDILSVEVDENEISVIDVQEQREEEKMALESIYAEAFSERIPNKVWSLNLQLTHLTEISTGGAEKKSSTDLKQKQKNGPLCKFFKRGNCRFGARCHQSHDLPIEPSLNLVEQSVPKLEDKSEEYPYELEIRFPGSHKYPFQVPVIAFSSRNSQLPSHVCLRITERLLTEAQELCESHAPIVFSLVSVLEDEIEMLKCFTCHPHAYSLPKPLVSMAAAIQAQTDEQFVPAPSPKKAEPVKEEEEEEEEEEKEEETMKQKYGRKDVMPRRQSSEQLRRIDRRLRESFAQKQNAPAYKRMQAARHRLPAAKWDLEIVQMLKHGQVLVISGMTGCGKTTQVPQFILDASLKSKTGQVANILCTQPRRISAMSVAERVADERAEKLGGIVGYQIRLESVMSTRTRLLFCTTGILLRRLESDPTLQGVTHILIDEVHERSEDSDFLMMVVRNLLPQRYDLKVILMSATLDAGLFSAYFNDCPRLEIPGRTFPVEQYFLEDVIEMTGYHLDERSPFARPLKRMNAAPKAGVSTRLPTDDIIDEIEQATNAVAPRHSLQDQNLTPKQLVARYPEYNKLTLKTLAMIDFDKINNELIELLLEWIVDGPHQYPREGAVLVFLPGLAEIKQVYELLLTNPVFGGRNKSRFWILPLHSTLSSEDQHRVFSTPPKGTTKIVLTTNIAETSITIDDVVYVIDSGRMKEKRYDASKSMESLDLVWESKANAQQRKGRAGRVASGVAFHLFTSHRHDYHMKPQPIPEIQRVPLEQLILRIKILDLFDNMQVEDVLSQLIEPPADIGIETAKSRLQDLGALDLDKNLTPLGYHLASLPVDVRIGKLMLFGAIFRCLDSALTIAATLSYRSPFVSPFDKRNEADKCKLDFAIGNSDHLTMLNAYKSWIKAQKDGSQAAFRFCQENFLSIKTMQMLATMKHQFTELLSDIGFIREGILCRDLERKFRGSDGVLAVTGQEANVHNDNMKLLSAILVAALFPNVVQIKTPEAKYSKTGEGAVARLPKPEELRFSTKSDGYVSIHPSSVNFQVRYYDSPYLVYHEKIKTTKVYIRDCSMVSVYPLLLFGGCIIAIDLDRNDFIMSVDEGWIRFKAANQEVAELVRELRLELNQLLRDKIEAPSMDLCACPRGSQIIETIVRLISTQ